MRTISLILATSLIAAPVPVLAGQQQDSVGRAATEPLRVTRIKDDKIPEVLQYAATAPYSDAHTGNCAAIASEITALDKALGRDVDADPVKKGESSAVAAAGARALVNTLIPGLGLVKVLTGADKQQRRVEAAVYAGSIRRGYLKGLGLAKRCRMPAAPAPAAVAARPELLYTNDD
ncbi:hypothetical protein [Sphingomonas immobilis]|uniref:Uncharacterized protein n=1 Tax=Sphingomonas immobilis TaxID=3063997 RepID=A0ABT9A3V2_9SPHN|nr:hypothetical protein [Sphingomonas sp. CA1-15]MDO7844524.1 hypothetical protein [Sphingomonas sp. CA1-15]